MKIVLMPLPSTGFDPTEAAISWMILKERGHKVRFATPDGDPATPDPLMLIGEGLDPWGFIPGLRKLRVLGKVLMARQDAVDACKAMMASEEYAPQPPAAIHRDISRYNDWLRQRYPGSPHHAMEVYFPKIHLAEIRKERQAGRDRASAENRASPMALGE